MSATETEEDPMTKLDLLDLLREAGYTPNEDAADYEDWFDLTLEAGTVRVTLDDGGDAKVYLLSEPARTMVWSAGWSAEAPDRLVKAILEVAEDTAEDWHQASRDEAAAFAWSIGNGTRTYR